MERNYSGYRPVRRRRQGAGRGTDAQTRVRAVKLMICAGIFLLAALIRLIFPVFFEVLGEKLSQSVDVKAAFSVIGEGISGERKLTSALGEALTYAFMPGSAEGEDAIDEVLGEDPNLPPGPDGGDQGAALPEDVPPDDEAQEVSGPMESAGPSEGENPLEGEEALHSEAEEFSNAVRSAFLETQEAFGDYSVPAGVSYEMPPVSFEYAAPVSGPVTSPFGFRHHPVDGEVRFHYGTDIAAEGGTPIHAFTDGTVLAVGDSALLGNYMILEHDGAETTYAHCDEIAVVSGSAVKRGDVIGSVGKTGNATDNCLHFEIRINGEYVNPEFYVQWA